MDKQLSFKFKARLANLFGTELVSSPSVALGELVKNSYDADATEVIITFRNVRKPGGVIIIEDNGEGMNADDLEQKWMVIGTQDKQEHPVSNRFKRRKVGEKGIGRFAVQRLGHKVLLKSKRQGEKTWNCLTINWDHYDRSSGLFDAIPNNFHQEPAPPDASGVIVTLENVREAWDEHSFNQLRKDLYLLFSPFREAEQNFKVLVIADEFPSFEGEIESEILDAAVVHGRAILDSNRHLSVEIFPREKSALPRVERDIEGCQCGPLQFEFHTFLLNRDGVRGTKFQLKHVRDMMDEYGGVRIYRNHVRVKPYGDKGNDWLELNLRRARNPEFRVSTNQIIGTIDIGRDENPDLIDQTNREGLIHNKAFEDLRQIVTLCLTAVEAYYWDIAKERRKKSQKPEYVIQRMEYTIEENENIPNPLKQSLIKTLREARSVFKQSENLHMSELQIYRNMATLGISVAVFGHETESAIYCMQNDCETALHILSESIIDNEILEKYIRNIKKSVNDLQSYSNLITDYLRKRKRERLEVSVNDIVNEVFQHYKYLIEHHKIDLKIHLPEDEVIMIDMYRMDLEAILVNFITNAVESLRQVEERKIIVHVQQLPSQAVEILFADSGQGVQRNIKDYIWNPFFTTKPNGLGLGLAIVSDIAEFYNGSVELIDGEILPGACFRIEIPMSGRTEREEGEEGL
jgi:signal transduction histidine kinase